MKTRRLAAIFGCLVLGACSSSAPGSLPLPAGASSEAHARPHAASTVDFHLLNKSPKWVLFTTEYSYPINPVWVQAHQMCVAPGKNWHTYIDFNHPHPQVSVHAITKTAGCESNPPDYGATGHAFKELKFENGRSLVEGQVEDNEKLGYLLCLRITGNGNFGCYGMHFH
jgi:hypothetical protein